MSALVRRVHPAELVLAAALLACLAGLVVVQPSWSPRSAPCCPPSRQRLGWWLVKVAPVVAVPVPALACLAAAFVVSPWVLFPGLVWLAARGGERR